MNNTKFLQDKRKTIVKFIRQNFLLICVMLSILIGFAMGFGLNAIKWKSNETKLWFTLPGILFVRALECLIIPVVFVSITCATSSISAKSNRRLILVNLGIACVLHILSITTALFASLIYISVNILFCSL